MNYEKTMVKTNTV